jgi:hypothetical protein
MFITTFFGNISGINKMTAATSAAVVSVSTASSTTTNGTASNSCSLIASYSVNGIEYTKQSAGSSSSDCALSQGQTININYDPANPGSWMYDTKTINGVLQIFFWAGLLFLVYSGVTFFVRLFSIIFGWKLLRDGRKNAANLPTDTNFQTLVSEIKQNFTSSLFGFGGSPNPPVPPTPNVPSN